MTAEPTYAPGGPPRLVGQVFATIVIRNYDDVALVRRGELDGSSVRQLVIDSMLVDTGATHICLPTDMIDALGMPVIRVVAVATATGSRMARIVGPAQV